MGLEFNPQHPSKDKDRNFKRQYRRDVARDRRLIWPVKTENYSFQKNQIRVKANHRLGLTDKYRVKRGEALKNKGCDYTAYIFCILFLWQ